MTTELTIPIEVVDQGKDAAWLYLYLARAKVRGDTLPSERQLADTLGVGRTRLRSMINVVEMVQKNQREPLANQTTIDNQQVTRAKKPTRTTCEPKASSPSSSPTTSLSSSSSTKELKEKLPKGSHKEKQKGIAERQKEFYDSLVPYVKSEGGKYEAAMVREFYDYWSEPTTGGLKFRKELERTWDTALRLARWSRNNYDKPTKASEVGKIINSRNDDDYNGW